MRIRSFAFSLLLMAASAVSARAAGTDFIGALSDSDKTASGIVHLSVPQQNALNAFATRDITLARQGDVTGFSGSFSERRTDEQKKDSGIDTLTRRERENLDALVATAISARPIRFKAALAAPAAPAPAPSLVLTPPHMEVHGDVTLMAGGGSHGSSFYGSAMDVVVTDPSGKFTLGVGYSNIHSKGLAPCLLPPFGY